MTEKLPPLMLDHRRHADRSGRAHHATRPVSTKVVDRNPGVDKEPRSTEETKADGNAFREALFGSSPNDVPAGTMPMGGFGEGGGQSRGQSGGGEQQEGRGGRRSGSVGKSASVQKAEDAQRLAEAGALEAAASGWMELEVESKVAGRIRLSVLKENGSLRARLSMGNPLAAQWMQEHLADVEAQLTDELGCRVRLEMS